MTATTDQFADIATRTQEAVTTAVRTWVDTVQSVTGNFAQPALPDAKVVVDRYFDFAQQVLDNQRTFAQTVLAAGTQAAETVTEHATKAAETVTEAAGSVVGKAATATSRATKPAAAKS